MKTHMHTNNVVTLEPGGLSGNPHGFRPGIAGLTPNPGAEIIRYGRSKPDLLFLGQGQGELPTPAFINEGVMAALDAGRTFYDSVLGIDPLRQEISGYYRRIYGFDVPMERIYVSSSGTTAMYLALTSLLSPGDEAVAVTPIWKNLLSAIELAEGVTKEVALTNKDGAWSLDLDLLFASVTAKTKVLLITTPSNPTGWVMPKDQIKAVLEFARSRNLWIIADEVYGRIVYDGTHAPSFLEYARPDDKLYVVNSFSKAWAMTGWRLGWLVGPAIAEPHIRDIALYNNMGPPTFTQYAGIEALRHGEDFLKSQIDLWRGNRELVAQHFAANDRIICDTPEATFYAFLKVDGEPDCMAFCRRLIDEQGLGLAPGCGFGRVGRGYVRLCFAVSQARLEAALERLDRAIGR
jgi:aspartate/methionine/tyrosine aminotransferase